MANTLKLSSEDARAILYGETDKGEVVEDKVVGNNRWDIIHDVVIKYDGRYWKGKYFVGATELQTNRPWEYGSSVEFTEVEKVQIMVDDWVIKE